MRNKVTKGAEFVMSPTLQILELYSGIGGMHYALKASGVSAKVVAAVDINNVANEVYRHNFRGTKLLQRNIQSLSVKELNSLEPDMILMSPPCQPFTRVGLKRDVNDERTDSFIYLLSIMPQLHSLKYILLENVKGFEESEARKKLVTVLDANGFIYQEFLLSPHQFYIPNVRLRYYIIAKRKPCIFPFQRCDEVLRVVPADCSGLCSKQSALTEQIALLNSKYCTLCAESSECFTLKNVLENGVNENNFLLTSKVLAKHAELLDIVTEQSRKTCCFTKAYGHYVEGTGSVLCPQPQTVISKVFEESRSLETGSEKYIEKLMSLKMRYFTPREVARLMCFPDTEFNFPEAITTKQRYRLLGNSINVHVVSLLIVLLTSE